MLLGSHSCSASGVNSRYISARLGNSLRLGFAGGAIGLIGYSRLLLTTSSMIRVIRDQLQLLARTLCHQHVGVFVVMNILAGIVHLLLGSESKLRMFISFCFLSDPQPLSPGPLPRSIQLSSVCWADDGQKALLPSCLVANRNWNPHSRGTCRSSRTSSRSCFAHVCWTPPQRLALSSWSNSKVQEPFLSGYGYKE